MSTLPFCYVYTTILNLTSSYRHFHTSTASPVPPLSFVCLPARLLLCLSVSPYFCYLSFCDSLSLPLCLPCLCCLSATPRVPLVCLPACLSVCLSLLFLTLLLLSVCPLFLSPFQPLSLSPTFTSNMSSPSRQLQRGDGQINHFDTALRNLVCSGHHPQKLFPCKLSSPR